MAVITNPQHNLPLACSKPNASLPEHTQVEAIAALTELILQVWQHSGQIDNPLEDKINE